MWGLTIIRWIDVFYLPSFLPKTLVAGWRNLAHQRPRQHSETQRRRITPLGGTKLISGGGSLPLPRNSRHLQLRCDLPGRARQIALSIPADELHDDNGIDKLFEKLDKSFERDEMDLCLRSIEELRNLCPERGYIHYCVHIGIRTPVWEGKESQNGASRCDSRL